MFTVRLGPHPYTGAKKWTATLGTYGLCDGVTYESFRKKGKRVVGEGKLGYEYTDIPADAELAAYLLEIAEKKGYDLSIKVFASDEDEPESDE